MASPPSEQAEDARSAPSVGYLAYEFLGYVGGFILAVMTAAVFIQVVMRFFGYAGIDGIEEVPRFLFVWLVMIGAAAAMWRNEHTILDYFMNLLPPKPRALLSAFNNALCIVLFGSLIHLSITLVPNAGFQTSAGLGLTLDYVFMAVPIGSALLIVPMLRNIYVSLRGLWRKPS